MWKYPLGNGIFKGREGTKPGAPHLSAMRHERIDLSTPDGMCPLHVVYPDGAGAWPAVIVFMDAMGVRPGSPRTRRRVHIVSPRR